MTEELSEEDIVGDVVGVEHVATDGAVGGAQVAWFPGLVEGAEGGGNVLGGATVLGETYDFLAAGTFAILRYRKGRGSSKNSKAFADIRREMPKDEGSHPDISRA